MAFSIKQQEYFMNATKRWNIKSGATRSGKTYMDYFVIPKRIRATNNKGLIVLLGNTQATLERNILTPMRRIYGSDLVGSINNKNEIRLFGKDCFALGADKKTAVDKLRGAGIEYCYGDEISTWAEAVFEMLKSRLDKPNSVFDGTTNPENPMHWLKLFLDSDADIYLQNYQIDDNPFLDKFFVEQLKKEYTGVYFQRYILGKWTRAEGLVYDSFDNDITVVPTIERRYTNYYIGIDYGTQNATVFQLWGISEGIFYLIKEYYHSGRESNRQKTDKQYADDLKSFIGSIDYEFVVLDPSAASFGAELQQRGIRKRSANNDVINGIRLTQSLLTQRRILINDCCEHTLKEIQAYSWDEKAASRGVDEVIKVDDHCMDALRYVAYTVMRKYYKGR